MDVQSNSEITRALPASTVRVLALGLLTAGCHSYQPVPLELQDHRSKFERRWVELEPVTAFAARLREQSGDAALAFDPNDGLDVSEGEVVGLFFNPRLRLSRLGAAVSRATAENAGLWQDPVFGFDGAELLSPSGPFELGLLMNLTLPVSGRLAVERERAGAAYEASLRQLVHAEWSLRIDVRRRWARWSAARERAQLLRDVVGQVERIRIVTDRLETGGALRRVEARLFRIELAHRRLSLSQAELEERNERVQLLGLLGLAPETEVDLVPRLSHSLVIHHEDPLARLIVANTTLAVRRAEYRAIEEALRLEVRKQFPDLTIGTGYGSEDGDDRLLLGLSLPIPVLNANRKRIAEARAQRDLARAAAESAYEQLSRSLHLARVAFDATQEQRSRLESDILPMLDDQAAEALEIAQLGDVNALLLLDTVSRHFDAKSRLLALRLAEVESALRIEQLLGPGPKAAPSPANHDPVASHRVEEESER